MEKTQVQSVSTKKGIIPRACLGAAATILVLVIWFMVFVYAPYHYWASLQPWIRPMVTMFLKLVCVFVVLAFWADILNPKKTSAYYG